MIEFPISESPISRTIQKVLPYLDMEFGPWVAGGSARLMFEGKTEFGNSDIDVFFPNQSLFDWAVALMKSQVKLTKADGSVTLGVAHKNSTKFTIAFDGQETTIQLINLAFYESAEALLDSFDFTCSMFATDGNVGIADKRAPNAAKSRVLELHHRPEKPKLARLAKYCAYGFMPGPDVLREMICVDLPTFNPTADSQVDEY